jgi:erythromycin esterase-like protein
VAELVEVRRRAAELIAKNGLAAEEDWFSAEQNALLIEDAERFYRAMFRERTTAWNQRDGHMAEALREIADFLQRKYQQSKIVVWAHNAHIGDGRAVTCGDGLKINLGQLVKEKFHAQAVSVGFTTYSGTVTAAADWWDSPPQRKPLLPAVEDSYEAVFHEVGFPRFMLNLREQNEAVFNLAAERPERTIGVIYRPETDALHAYTQARIARQFDALIHIDQTRAVEPIEHLAAWDTGEVPAMFPAGV